MFILGAGGPSPTPDRYVSSYLLSLGDEYLMFDCGPATTYKNGKDGNDADAVRTPILYTPSLQR